MSFPQFVPKINFHKQRDTRERAYPTSLFPDEGDTLNTTLFEVGGGELVRREFDQRERDRKYLFSLYVDLPSFELFLPQEGGNLYCILHSPDKDAAIISQTILKTAIKEAQVLYTPKNQIYSGQFQFQSSKNPVRTVKAPYSCIPFQLMDFVIAESPVINREHADDPILSTGTTLSQLQSYTWRFFINPFVARANGLDNIVIAVPSESGNPLEDFASDNYWWAIIADYVITRDKKSTKQVLEAKDMQLAIEKYNLYPQNTFEVTPIPVILEPKRRTNGNKLGFIVRIGMNNGEK